METNFGENGFPAALMPLLPAILSIIPASSPTDGV
jgi:hypothetical protein